MAKIELISIREGEDQGDKINAIGLNVFTKVSFHPIDVALQMEYRLHLLLVKTGSKWNIPILYPNWDEVGVVFKNQDPRVDFLGNHCFTLKAGCSSITLEKFFLTDPDPTTPAHKTRALATLVPVVSRATAWTNFAPAHSPENNLSNHI